MISMCLTGSCQGMLACWHGATALVGPLSEVGNIIVSMCHYYFILRSLVAHVVIGMGHSSRILALHGSLLGPENSSQTPARLVGFLNLPGESKPIAWRPIPRLP